MVKTSFRRRMSFWMKRIIFRFQKDEILPAVPDDRQNRFVILGYSYCATPGRMNIWKNRKMEKVGQRPLTLLAGDPEPQADPCPQVALPGGEVDVKVHSISREGLMTRL
jgi:hypothetical protein